MTIQSLATTLQEEFERANFLSRTHASIGAIRSEKGNGVAALAITLLSGSAVAGGSLCWLTLEGAVRSCIDLADDPREIVRLRALGDAGGWTSLALFTVLAVKAIYEVVIHEGEYIRFKDICRTWLVNRDQDFKEEVYPQLYDFLHALSTRCIFVKSVSAKRVIAVELCNPPLDSRLQDTFKNIASQLGPKAYCKSCCRTFSARGCSVNLSAKIFGVVFPILFMINFVLSVVGEVGLGHEIFVNREDLTAIGHFGEWPINAIEAVASAYLLYRWYIGTDTAIAATRKVYQDSLAGLEPELNDRLREVGAEEIKQLASSSGYLQLPTDHDIDEITERLEHL